MKSKPTNLSSDKKRKSNRIVVTVNNEQSAKFLRQHLDAEFEELAFENAPQGQLDLDDAELESLLDHDTTTTQAVNLTTQSMRQMLQQQEQTLTILREALRLEREERHRMAAALKLRLEIDRVIASISAHFINLMPEQVDQGIDLALHVVAEFMGADRSYLFMLTADQLRMDNSYEWYGQGIESHQAALQGIPVLLFPWLMGKLHKNESIAIPQVTALEPAAQVERKFLLGRECQSALFVPISYHGYLIGFWGMEAVRSEQTWSADMETLLKIVGEIFAKALEHKRTEEAFRQQLREIADAMLEFVCRVSSNGIIEEIISYSAETFGYASSELLGYSFFENVHPEDRSRVSHEARQGWIADYRYRTAKGHYIWLETQGNKIPDDRGQPGAMVLASRDISQRKAVERNLEELNRVKTEFLSTAAHELRTPLTSIRGFSEILLARKLDEQRQVRYLTFIHEQSEYLAEIIDDLLDITQMETTRQLPVDLEMIEMSALVQRICRPFIESTSNHHFRFTGLRACPPVMGDPERLMQVLKNIISNAVKYSPQGGAITINFEMMGSALCVSVADQGIGMDPEQKAHLFEKFYRADASNTTLSGTGLGLAICKLIIELHQGKIWAESEYGWGSIFYFTLPLATPEQLSQF